MKKDRESVFKFLEELQIYEASSVIDEMLFYLKEQFFAQNEDFSILIYERFFRILARAKNMACDDDAFTLCVIAFMMMEATFLKEIDAQIEIQKEQIFKNEKIVSEPKIENLTEYKIPKLEPKIEIKPIINEQNHYEKLKALIYDRDFNLGKCFEKNTEFASFDGENLNIISNALGEARQILNAGFKLILNIWHENFGKEMKLKIQKAVQIDESKLQSVQNQDLLASMNNLKTNAPKYDKNQETLETLSKCFGEPEILPK